MRTFRPHSICHLCVLLIALTCGCRMTSTERTWTREDERIWLGALAAKRQHAVVKCAQWMGSPCVLVADGRETLMFRMDIERRHARMLVAPTGMEIFDFSQSDQRSFLLCSDRENRRVVLCLYSGSSLEAECVFVPGEVEDPWLSAVVGTTESVCCVVGGRFFVWHADQWRELSIPKDVVLDEVWAQTPLSSHKERVAVLAKEDRAGTRGDRDAMEQGVAVVDVERGTSVWIRPGEGVTGRPVDLAFDRGGNLWVLYEAGIADGERTAHLCRFAAGLSTTDMRMVSATSCGTQSWNRALVLARDDSPTVIDAGGVRRLCASGWERLANWERSGWWVVSAPFDAMIDSKNRLFVVGEYLGAICLDPKTSDLITMPLVEWMQEMMKLH